MKQPEDTAPTSKTAASKLATTVSSTVSCYGCGKPGYIRSNCPKCNTEKTSTSALDFCVLDTINEYSIAPRSRPVLNIEVFGFHGTGIVDTAAKQSVARHTLYKILEKSGQCFKERTLTVRLADGCSKTRLVLITRVNVILQNRIIPTTFVVFTDTVDNNILLGIDFVEDAKVTINVFERVCTFSGEQSQKYELV